ncbi:metal-dependent hydrolase [Robertkochia solimangrovi]|nr:metal-dependent hydrolase [Robertkochia solimangrovi]
MTANPSTFQTFEQFMRGRPVIDVHMHLTKGYEGNEAYNPQGLTEGDSLDQLKLKWTQQEMEQNNVVLALAGGTAKYAGLYAEADEDFWGGLQFPCSKLVEMESPCEKEFFTYDELKELYEKYELKILGESVYNYYGIPPTDIRLEPYWKFAADMDLPVGVHSDTGPPKVDEKERPNYSPQFANPELLAPILEKYPNLRIILMHYGGGYTEEAIALMKKYPQVYCDFSAICIMMPKQIWEPNLRLLYEEGLGDRLMFGSDYTGTIEQNLRVVYDIGWLDNEEKYNILYHNAARFLRLKEEQIISHYREVSTMYRKRSQR